MPFLGIDQSLRGTGLCLLSEAGEVLSLKTVRLGASRGAARLACIHAAVLAQLSSVTFVAMEGYSYNSTSRHFDLGEVGGVLKLMLHEREIPFLSVAPCALKKYATGNSEASKEAMMEAAHKHGIDVHDDNQADAFFLADVARQFSLDLCPRNRCQLEVLHQLKSPPPPRRRRAVRRTLKNAL